MSNAKEQFIRAAFRLKVAKKKVELLNEELKSVGLAAKCDINFINTLLVQKYLPLEFSVFMPGWSLGAYFDEQACKIIITHLEKGNARIVMTNKGWSYQPKGFLLTEGYVCRPKDAVDVTEINRFCSDFCHRYGVEVELLIVRLLPSMSNWSSIEGRKYYNG